MSELSTLSSCQCGNGPREEEGLGRGNMARLWRLPAWPGFLLYHLELST